MENNIEHIMAQVLGGHASSDEIIRLGEWLHDQEDNKKEFRKLKAYWDAEVSFNHSFNGVAMLEKLQRKIRRGEIRRRQKYVMLLLTGAAALLALLFAFPPFSSSEKTTTEHSYTYLTDQERSEITLEDGTKVMLNKKSRLTYSDAYGTLNRKVSLQGEAYFEVTKNPALPFEVCLGKGASVKVLGTVFNVKEDREKNEVVTTLVSGSVRFECNDQQVILAPDQQLVFDRTTHRLAIRSVNTAQVVGWKEQLLKYQSIGFASLLRELEKIYPARFIITDKKWKDPRIQVSGTFSKAQTPEEILRVISRTLPIQWTCKDGNYYIR